MSVRSVVQVSSRRNGVSICPTIVFGTCGPARPAYRFEDTVYLSASKLADAN